MNDKEKQFIDQFMAMEFELYPDSGRKYPKDAIKRDIEEYERRHCELTHGDGQTGHVSVQPRGTVTESHADSDGTLVIDRMDILSYDFLD